MMPLWFKVCHFHCTNREFSTAEGVHRQTYIVEHLGWRPLNAIGSTMGSVAERYKKQSLAQKQGSVEYMIVFIKLSFWKVFEDP